MDFKRLMMFFAASLLVLMGWEYLFPTPKPTTPVVQEAASAASSTSNTGTTNPTADTNTDAALLQTSPITVTTDLFQATIDEKSGDLRRLVLLKYNATSDEKQPFVLFDDTKQHQYIAQSLLLTPNGDYLLKDVSFSTPQKNYTLTGDTLEVRLSAPEVGGIQADKVYTFRKGSYAVNVRFDISNRNTAPAQLSSVYRLLRDGTDPEGSGYFDHTYTGPVLYTPQGKFEKVSFGDLDSDYSSGRDQADYVRKTDTGWVGMTQHYFMATWILQPKGGSSVCQGSACQIDIRKRSDGLYSTGVRVGLTDIAPNTKASFPVELYAGPQDYSSIIKVADNLQLIKDYGKVSLFASPLFWMLNKLHEWVGNWGWAIVLLTLIVKAILFPLTNAAYRSMAKMRAVAPRLQALKEQYGDDRMKMQQEMMAMYKKEKINPLGGCLPMLLQIPVFIGLYWALFSSVELRQAPWIGWITDLGRIDPYYILPILMAITMFIQTHLNPAPTDPMQAKMMKIMPVIFSVMFFFFPAGLVLYWLTNNIITIGQQWYINKSIEKQQKLHHKLID
ncbi:membrane protein insertase YidC [Stenoxybacter acetivorans]|uniref:membrane protein insertase YidC n=1 Tax=Stenoxybacter acetivorans TaxID=422441 RepID=UPI000559E813|nr:membrane protein insertase YidC [Stenoxybacter acetivorans]